MFEDGLNFIFEFIDFFALGLEDGVFFFEESEISPEEFLDSVGMFVKFGDDGLAPGTSFLDFWFVLTFSPFISGNVASLSHEYLGWV